MALAHPDEICVLSRFHSAKSIAMLDTALFSLLGQGVNLKSIVLCQELDATTFAEVEALCCHYRTLGLNTVCFNERFDDTGDHRAELLNRGMARSESRYLAFLDCDDVVYPGIYSKLMKRLDAAPAAVAFGGCVRADYYNLDNVQHFTHKFLLFQSLPTLQFFNENQYPIHSYVIDVTKVDKEDIYFDKGESRNEDYAFLYRILRKYNSDNHFVSKKMCEYRVDVDGSNTIMAFDSCPESALAWATAEEYMGGVRRSKKISVEYDALLEYSAWIRNSQRVLSPSTDSGDVKIDIYWARLQSLLSSWTHDLKRLSFYVDSISWDSKGQRNLSGWMHGDGSRPFFAVCLAADGQTICAWDEFVPREDVAAAYRFSNNQFGFSIKVPPGHEMIRIKCITYDNECFVSPLFSLEEGGMVSWSEVAELPAEQFIERLYADILGRRADRAGRIYHTKLVKDGASRVDIVNVFLTSQEFKDARRDVRIVGMPEAEEAPMQEGKKASLTLLSFLKSRANRRRGSTEETHRKIGDDL